MIFHTKMPYEVPNDVIMYHEKRIEWNILISACKPYGFSPFHYFYKINSVLLSILGYMQ